MDGCGCDEGAALPLPQQRSGRHVPLCQSSKQASKPYCDRVARCVHTLTTTHYLLLHTTSTHYILLTTTTYPSTASSIIIPCPAVTRSRTLPRHLSLALSPSLCWPWPSHKLELHRVKHTHPHPLACLHTATVG